MGQFRSASGTINALITSSFFSLFDFFDRVLRTRVRLVRPTFAKAWNEFFEGSFEENGRRVFHEHYKKIQNLVPPDRVLFYHASEGWGPLCEFLGQPVPSVPMPHENELRVMQQKFKKALLYNVHEYVTQIFSALSGTSFVILALSAICGDNILGPRLRHMLGTFWGLMKQGLSDIPVSPNIP